MFNSKFIAEESELALKCRVALEKNWKTIVPAPKYTIKYAH
jgi:hypothetical protein